MKSWWRGISLLTTFVALTALAFAWGGGKGSTSNGVLIPRQSLIVWESSDTSNKRNDKTVKFELENVGGNPIRIIKVESGCGCAKPVFDKELVSPGQFAMISMMPTAIAAGQRDIAITVHTDSTSQPTINLVLRTMSRRKPPFFAEVWGDLTFRGTFDPTLQRELTIVGIETTVGSPAPHINSSNLPFLEITPTGDEVEPYYDTGFLIRKRHYQVRFREKPKEGNFLGNVVVTDPHYSDNILTLNVIGQFGETLRASPSAVTFTGDSQLAKIVVISDEPTKGLSLSVLAPEGVKLEPQAAQMGQSGKVWIVSVSKGEYSGRQNRGTLQIRRLEASSRELEIPIIMLAEEKAVP